MTPIPHSFRVLMTRLIDYAGSFPPAALPCGVAANNFAGYRDAHHAWMLGRLVVNHGDLDQIPHMFDGALSVLANSDVPRASAIESKQPIQAARPVYCELPATELDQVKAEGCFAKIRTGGVKPEAIPAVAEVASFIRACAERRLAFKATAGLHHPVRSEQALTYATDSPRAVMHGFLNVFMAACFAWRGHLEIEPVLEEVDPAAFHFDACAHWRDWSLDPCELEDARANFAHSFGSCSFEEPVRDLQSLGLL